MAILNEFTAFLSFGVQRCHGAPHSLFFRGIVLVPWLFSPAGSAAMTHTRATEKTVERALGIGSLVLATAAAAKGIGSQFFVSIHGLDQFLVHCDDLLRKAAVGRHEHLDCGWR